MSIRHHRSLEIQQELQWIIQEYGLTKVIEALYLLICNHHLGSFEDNKLRTIATHIAFALSEATDQES